MGQEHAEPTRKLDEAPRSRRFFTTISTDGKKGLRRLADYDIDLIVSSAAVEEEEAHVEAILSFEEIERLVDAGYEVRVADPVERRANVSEFIGFEEWLRGMEEDLGSLKGEEDAT